MKLVNNDEPKETVTKYLKSIIDTHNGLKENDLYVILCYIELQKAEGALIKNVWNL